MPRYISKYRGQSFVAIPTITNEEHFRTGQQQRRGIVCDFTHAGLSPWEKDEALRRFNFGGAGHDEDLSHRLSYFDTDLEAQLRSWSAEDKAEVERRLESAPSFGVDFIRVDKPEPALPYAAYDKHRKVQGRRTVDHVVADVQRAAEVAGVDVAAVVSYEREVGGPSELIAALEALAPVVPVVEPDEVVAA